MSALAQTSGVLRRSKPGIELAADSAPLGRIAAHNPKWTCRAIARSEHKNENTEYVIDGTPLTAEEWLAEHGGTSH